MKIKPGITSILIVALFALMIATSCRNTDTNYQDLIAKEWALERVTHDDSLGTIVVPNGVYIIFSDSGRVYGNAGCNNFNGPYEHAGHNQIGMSRLASTMMWCFNMEFETAFMRMLEKVTEYQADEEKLILTGTEDSFTLYFRPRGPQDDTGRL